MMSGWTEEELAEIAEHRKRDERDAYDLDENGKPIRVNVEHNGYGLYRVTYAKADE